MTLNVTDSAVRSAILATAGFFVSLKYEACCFYCWLTEQNVTNRGLCAAHLRSGAVKQELKSPAGRCEETRLTDSCLSYGCQTNKNSRTIR